MSYVIQRQLYPIDDDGVSDVIDLEWNESIYSVSIFNEHFVEVLVMIDLSTPVPSLNGGQKVAD